VNPRVRSLSSIVDMGRPQAFLVPIASCEFGNCRNFRHRLISHRKPIA